MITEHEDELLTTAEKLDLRDKKVQETLRPHVQSALSALTGKDIKLSWVDVHEVRKMQLPDPEKGIDEYLRLGLKVSDGGNGVPHDVSIRMDDEMRWGMPTESPQAALLGIYGEIRPIDTSPPQGTVLTMVSKEETDQMADVIPISSKAA